MYDLFYGIFSNTECVLYCVIFQGQQGPIGPKGNRGDKGGKVSFNTDLHEYHEIMVKLRHPNSRCCENYRIKFKKVHSLFAHYYLQMF